MNEAIAVAQRIRVRLFLEGQEVPVISAQVSAAPNSPAMCAIQVPPAVEGTRLLPRTLVHLYFLDAYVVSNPYLLDSDLAGKVAGTDENPDGVDAIQGSEGASTSVTPLTLTATACGNRQVDTRDNRKYKLLFSGEVVGYAWTKSPSSRSLVLQCEDFSNYWDYAYQWSNTGIFGPGMKAIFSGGATNLFTDFLSSEGSVITSLLLQGKCSTFPKLGGLSAGIVSLIEAIGGCYYTEAKDVNGNSARKFAGQTIFFSLAELRLHITQMVGVYEDDPTSTRLISRDGYGGMFGRVLGGLGQQVSIRKAISAVTSVMFHEIYPQPCPYFKPGGGNNPSGTRRVSVKGDPRLSAFAAIAAQFEQIIIGIIARLETIKEQNVQFEYLIRGLDDIHTRLMVARTQLLRASSEARSNGAPSTLTSSFLAAANAIGKVLPVIYHWKPTQAESAKAQKIVIPQLTQAKNALHRIPNMMFNTTALKQRIPSQLVQHILRPDVWFTAPPRCNVLFPDSYTQLSYRRAFLQEPTRLMLKTNDDFFGEDDLFDKFYMAPKTLSLKSQKTILEGAIKNDILDHELFTGILPIFEKMGEFNVFAARANDSLGSAGKVGFAQRSTNFLYFKHRFNARQLEVVGRFNPYVAVGFPGLVIDGWVDQAAAARARAVQEQFGTDGVRGLNSVGLGGANFLVNFAEVTHQVSQEQLQGVTSIRCTYARQVDEGVEFLGVSDPTKLVQKRQEGDATRVTDMACISPPAVGSLGPNQGVISAVCEVTDKYAGQKANRRSLPVYFGGFKREKGTRSLDAQVPIGELVNSETVGTATWQKLEPIRGELSAVTFRAFTISEQVPRYRLEQVEMPMEELIRPGWYGDIWSPAKVQDAYKDFFGIGSITETIAILDGSGGSVGEANERFRQAIEEQELAYEADDPRVAVPLVTSLEENSTIQQAVEFLTLTYSYVKQAGLDVDEFIRAYTWRPVASLIDMFGTENLQFNENGTEVIVDDAIEGFHSRAFGPYDDVFGLVGPELVSVIGIERGTAAAQKGDTRKRKYEAVQSYLTALNYSNVRLG